MNLIISFYAYKLINYIIKNIFCNIKVIHSFVKHELNAYSTLTTVVCSGVTTAIKTNRTYVLRKEQQYTSIYKILFIFIYWLINWLVPPIDLI